MEKYLRSLTLPYLNAILIVLIVSRSNGQTSSFNGHVIDGTSHRPLAQAVVVMLELGQKKITDDEGRFNFQHLASGRYTLTVHHIAYADIERRIIVPGDTVDTVEIVMLPALLRSDEVVVSSTRTSSAFNDTPYPIEIVTSDRLARQSNISIPDALQREPGIAMIRDGAWETELSIRGMSRSNIVTLVDNTRIETAQDIAGSLSLISLDDLERAEIIKSPGSSLYGSGAIGGVVHLVTKRPSFTDQWQTRVECAGGATSVNGGFSQHISFENSDRRYAMRVSGGYRRAGDMMTPEGALPNSQFCDFNIYGTFGLKPIDNHSLFLTYQRSQADDTGISGGSPIASSAVATYILARREMFSFEYTIPNISFRLPLLTFRSSRQVIERDVEIIQSPVLTLTPHAIHTTTSFQLESKISPGGECLLIVGAEAWQRNLDSRRERINTSRNEIIGERPVPRSSYFSGGVYAQNEWHAPTENVTIVTGARYDLIRVSNDETMNPEYLLTSGGLQTSPSNQQILWGNKTVFNESWSVNAGLTCALNSRLDVTFLAATAFRAPSLEERFQFIDLGNVVRVGNPNLQPEKSKSLNGGLRLHTGNFRVQTDIFLNKLSNLVTEIPGNFEGRPAYIKTNVGEARLFGFEVSSETSLLPWTATRLTISFVKGEDTRNHLNLPQIAPVQGSVESSFSIPAIGTASLSTSFTLRQVHAAAGEIETPGYTVFGIDFSSASFNSGPLSFSLKSGIQNLLNTTYRNHLTTLRGLLQLEPGRNYFLAATITL